MKRLYFLLIMIVVMGTVLPGCGAGSGAADSPGLSDGPDINAPKTGITEEMACEGVSNYCRSVYDWSIAEDNPDIMYVELGEETESEYQVIFRSYTGTFVYFYVDKSSGITRLTEYVPMLEIEEDVGVINLYDYLELP